jgi:hypothetical protein
MKKYLVMAILGLLLGVTSPFPIWPGPEFLKASTARRYQRGSYHISMLGSYEERV